MADTFRAGDHPRGVDGQFVEKPTLGTSAAQIDALRRQTLVLLDDTTRAWPDPSTLQAVAAMETRQGAAVLAALDVKTRELNQAGHDMGLWGTQSNPAADEPLVVTSWCEDCASSVSLTFAADGAVVEMGGDERMITAEGGCAGEVVGGEDYFDESMDGDHESGLRDAGFGTDEDYGLYDGGDEPWDY